MEIEDIIENGATANRPGRLVALVVALILLGVGFYGGNKLLGRPEASAATPAAPTVPAAPAAPAATSAPLSTASTAKQRSVVPETLLGKALASISVEPGSAGGGALEVVGSNYLNGSDALGFEDGTIGGPGRYAVYMLCLGHGTILVFPADGPDVNPVTSDGVRITCTAEPGAPLSTEVTLTGNSMQLYLQPDSDTVGAFAFRAHRR